ncbi:MAG: exonuclease SbcCD subunit D [Gemella haemolysans]|uniref:exonuclease SbcCD subunit D n=1 Tax=Gemella haemolysans TaxID=1379 RepID=UPI0026EFFEA6|nr:exonuclease SbcCD subunit D [Gemella haemolysans]MBS5318602.1 exonuclease SbcCD subunit D [Gemella haemolysans]
MVKFLHTADWHIGRKLQGLDLLEDQQFVLENLITEMKKINPDFLIIAGDLYDRSVPSKEATKLLQELLVKINIGCNIPIFAISGNHDSKERLAIGEVWFSKHKFYLHTRLEQAFDKLSYEDADIYLLPYFEPFEAREYFEDATLTTHNAATKRVIDEIYKNLDTNKTNILVAHTFVSGGLETDSEREISVGTVENVAVEVFDKFDYVALGHLHNPNAIKETRLKYSGSPMAYSFSEASQTKGMRLIEVTKECYSEEFIPLKQKRKLHNISASYEEVLTKEFQQNYDCKNNYFSMELSGLEGITDPLPRIKEYYPNVLILKQKRNTGIDNEVKLDREMLTKSPLQLIEGFYNEQTGSELTEGQKRVLVNIIDKVNQDETN